MSNEIIGNGSLMKLDPAGGASYESITNQTNGTLTIEGDIIEATSKSSSQNKIYVHGNTGWSASIEGYCTTDPMLNFDGSNDYAHVADDADFDFATDITLYCYVIPDVVSGTQYLIHKHDGSDGCSLALSGDEVVFVVDNSGSTSSSTATDAANLVAGTGYRIKAVFDGGTTTTKIYVNESDEAVTVTGTVPATCGVNATRVTIAGDAAGANLYDGKMGNAALSSAGTLNDQIVTPLYTGVVAYYRFDDGATNPTDSSGNSHTLTGVSIAAADYGDQTYYTIQEAWENKNSFTLQFAEAGTADTYTGTVFVESLAKTAPQNDVKSYSIGLRGSGELEIA